MFVITPSAKAALQELLETVIRPVPSDWAVIKFGNQAIGRMDHDCYQAVETFLNAESELGLIQADGESLCLYESTPHALSSELRVIAEHLREKGFIPGWRNEDFAFFDDQGHERFRLERAAFRTFGLLSRAIHINGYTNNHRIWLARRSSNKATHPGLLDNFAAGGVSADETIRSCAIKELWEEAGVPRELALDLNPISLLVGQRLVPPRGLHHELLFTFDLLLPSSFEPSNQDGEVSAFELIDFEEAIDRVLAEEMTPDAGVVTADFLLRHCRTND